MKTLSRKLFYQNQVFNIFFDHIIDEDGYEVKDYLVIQPKNMKGNTSGVGILPIINNKIGLIEIFRPAIQEICWEIAHGFIEKNETNEEAAIRELKEETGIESNKKDLISLGLVSPDSGVIGSKMNLFAVEIGKKNLFELDEFGIKDFKFFSFKDVERMIKNSKIHDSYTIASVYKYKVLKKLS